MKLLQHSLQTLLLAGVMGMSISAASASQPDGDPALADEMNLAMPFYGPLPMGHWPCGGERGMPPEHGEGTARDQRGPMPPPLPFARMPMAIQLFDLQLTDAQSDKVFAIVYAMEPEMRAQMKLMRQSREALAKLAESDDYSDVKLKALTETNAKAMAALMQMRVRADHQIYVLLTPDQRKQLADRRVPGKPMKRDGVRPQQPGR